MILDVGCGGGRFLPDPHGEVNCDIDRTRKVENFVQCDAHHLPFRAESFSHVWCANVLEHVKDPMKVYRELYRVSNSQITIVQDKLWSLVGYATSDHLWFQLPKVKFLKYPRTPVGKALSDLLMKALLAKVEWQPGRVFAFAGPIRFLATKTSLNLMTPRYTTRITKA